MMQVGHLVAVLAHDRGVEHACRRAQIVQYRLHRVLHHTGDFFAKALEIFQILGELPARPAVLLMNAIKISPANRRPNKALSVRS